MAAVFEENLSFESSNNPWILLRHNVLERLHSRLLHALEQRPLDLDRMEFVCSQDLVFCSAISSNIDIPDCIMETLSELCRMIRADVQDSRSSLQVQISSGHTGRPKIHFSPEYLHHLLKIPLSVTTITRLLGVSRHTVHRRLSENNMSVTALYSKMTDEELDAMVADIKIMYLGAANNNLSSTTLALFQESVEKYGFPLRVRADQGVENVAVTRLMISVRGTGNASFITGKSAHNQRIERLWRDVYMAVTNVFYSVLHTLEDEGYLDLSNELHLFSCHYVFVPRLQASLDVFRDGWDNHPLKSEQNLTPNQMWEMGQMQSPVPDPVFGELHIPDIEWESSGLTVDYSSGISIPVIESPLDEQEMDHLKRLVDPIAPSSSYGMDVYLAAIECVQGIINSR